MRNPEGDILVFLPGQEDIETLLSLVKDYAYQLKKKQMRLLVCPLFAALPPSEQQKVFEPAPANTRKVILATNIAETSITIPGIKYVIDCGLAKLRGFNPKIGVESLLLHPISKSSAWQRTGRAGREVLPKKKRIKIITAQYLTCRFRFQRAGICYRLYTEDTFRELQDDTVPEIRRCNLAAAVLALKASGVENILEFDYMDPPSRTSRKIDSSVGQIKKKVSLTFYPVLTVIRALEELYALGAMDETGKLSTLGRKMAEFPVDPRFAKVLIQSAEYGCTFEVIAIISLLSVENIFFSPSDKREQAAEARRKFLHNDGDHLMLLNVLKGYWEVKGDYEWCRENFINARNIKIALVNNAGVCSLDFRINRLSLVFWYRMFETSLIDSASGSVFLPLQRAARIQMLS